MPTATQTLPRSEDSRFRSAEPATTAGVLALPVTELLRELAGVVAQLSPAQYTRRCGETFFNGNIGGHVRHCLDHIRAILDGFSIGVVDYDHRERGTNIESDPFAARDEIRRLRRLAEDLAQVEAAAPVRVAILPTRDGQSVNLKSTLGRELAFVLSHTIHHNAMIKGMAVALGLSLPQTFGYAPSTLSHLDQSEDACAR
ncbi:MAG: DinB family protein [Phycisphaerales bacterium]